MAARRRRTTLAFNHGSQYLVAVVGAGPAGLFAARQLAQAGAHVTLQVADHGVGIPAAELARITERFFRASNVTGTFSGTGIGLAGVRQIVEQHGGRLTIDSTEGQGTTVTVALPMHGDD